MVVALFAVRNLLVIPVNMIHREKAIFLAYLVLACLFFKLVTRNINLNLDLVAGETISVLVKNGISGVVSVKS